MSQIHAAFGLRYLLANLGDLRARADLAEVDINQRPLDIAEALLARNPKIIGFGVYIWNVEPTAEIIAAIKRVRPDDLLRVAREYLTAENTTSRYGVEEHAGHDFWLTRNGHGCGFWDGDWTEPAATKLTESAENFGDYDLYIGDDGKIYRQ